MVDTTIDQLNTVLQQFADQIESVKEQPAKVDHAFDQAAIAMAASEGNSIIPGLGAVLGGAYGAITKDDFSGYMQDHKEQIKNKIKELLQALHDAIEGMRAPVAFLQASEDWLALKGKIGQAQNNEVANGNLLGYWQGAAAAKYGAARTLQDTAMDSAKATCDTLRKALADVSNTSWQLYTDLVSELTEFLVHFGAALIKISSGIEAPWGISDCIDLLGDTIKDSVDYLTKFGNALLVQKRNIGDIVSAMDNPKGFYGNHWPQSMAKSFNLDAPGVEWQAT
ncbi:hypothetical protein ACFYTQ_35245 [Nocardia sp. NPDC004068]|uniref:hypothetical protein n=1 Tax=Nocardia sp. NPDC004068 TaxID=3364303 RepID=UPI0036AD4453